MRHINIPIFIPQFGCPHQCIFCNQKKISSQTSVPEPDEIRSTIAAYLEAAGDLRFEAEIAYFGGSFTALPQKTMEEYLETAREFLKRESVRGLRISTRPDYIDEEILVLLKTKGVTTIELGIQSFEDRVLQASGRQYGAEQAEEACRLIKNKNFRLGIQLMAGLPEDNYRYAMLTAERTAALKPDMVRIYPTLVIKETPLEALFRNHKYCPLTLAEAVDVCAGMAVIIRRENIPIIRMGLQPSEELRTEGNVAAGPFHPAFGELVEQKIFYDQARVLLRRQEKNFYKHKIWYLRVNPKDVSKMTGYKRNNITNLNEEFDINLKVKIWDGQPRNMISLDN
ncbi:MAG: radical SAM protein [Syntrophomonadaceae bacterium]|jgi:histone acetyltransferase (RNA polymerase elongator complex component)|nr:radical SAM protein [Syntrophomonadaceae bacterium]